MITNHNRPYLSLLLAVLLTLSLVSGNTLAIQPAARPQATTTRSYNSGPLEGPDVGGLGPGSVDDSTATTAFTVLPGDFIPGSIISSVTIDIAFAKSSDQCPPPAVGGDDWAEELRFRLFAPNGDSLTLVDFNQYRFSNPEVGPVTVTFDDAAPTTVVGLPIQSGAFRPSGGALADFAGLDPAAQGGIWQLELADNEVDDPICFSAATLHLTVEEPTDLSLTQSDSPDPVAAGELLTYQITVHNPGPGIAANTVVTDTLPVGLEYVADTGDCTLSAGELVCPLGDIPPASQHAFQILTRVPAAAVATTPNGLLTLQNAATAGAHLNDPNLDNNTATQSTFVTERADLRAVKLSRPTTTVAAGETFTYTVFVDNLGPSFARHVVLTDTLLSSGVFTLLEILTDTHRADTCETVPAAGGTAITCTLAEPLEVMGYAPAHGRWQVRIRARAEEAQTIENSVVVQAATPDPDPANNTAQVFTAITAVTDLSVSKSPVEPVMAGKTATLHSTLHNSGPSTARNVLLVEELPAGVTLLSQSHPGMTCHPSAGIPATLTCAMGQLAPGARRALTLTVGLDPDLPDGAVLISNARVSGDTFDADNTNDSASTPIAVTSSAALSVTKTSTPESIAAGEPLAYTLIITNAGPSTAHGVTLLDALPAALELLDVTGPSGSSCYTLPGKVTCELPTFAPGAVAQVLIQTRARPAAVPTAAPDGSIQITNTVTISADNAPETQATSVTTVSRLSDLTLTKTGDPPVAYAGELVHYTLSLHNAGPSDAAGVVLTDTLPPALSYQTVTDDCVRVATDPDVVRCTVGALPARETRTVHLHARVRPDASPESTALNHALVTGAPTDPDPTNNVATASTSLLGLADLRVAQYGRPGGQVHAGERITYTLVVDNLGPGNAHDVLLEDTLASEGSFELLSVTSNRVAVCAPGSGAFDQLLELECALEQPLETTGRWTVELVVQATEAQTLANFAQVTGSDLDPDPTNNYASITHEITAVADLNLTKALMGEIQIDGEPGGTFALLPDRVTAGAQMTYTLTLTNTGPSAAQNATVQDRLPAWITLQRVTPSQGTCNVGVPGNPAAPLVCGLGTLAAGNSATIIVVAQVDAQTPGGTLLESDALAHSSVYDPHNADNFTTHRTDVDAWTDLAIQKSASPDLALPGQLLTYTLDIQNRGPSDAQGAVVEDLLPAGIDDVHWTCSATGGATCTSEGTGDIVETVSLPAGSALHYTLEARLTSAQVITNTATVTPPPGSGDPYLLDNQASVSNRPAALYLPLVLRTQYVEGPDLVIEELIVGSHSVQVVIRNQGTAPVTRGFWVDLYVNPSPAPRGVNQVWAQLATQGMAWGVDSRALPLQPGELLILSIGDAYYWPDLSRVTWPLPGGAQIYAQVDSYGPDSTHGLVLENHEMTAGAYNNITGPVLAPVTMLRAGPRGEAQMTVAPPPARPPLR